jgi:hypothetical protein
VTVLATIIGLALLAWQVRVAGVDHIRDGIKAVGFGFLGILLFSGLRYVVRAQAWLSLMADGAAPGLGRTTAAVIAGDAVGNLTPLRLLASEPTKAMLLGKRVVTSRALAALVAENVFYSASVAFVIILGTAAMLVAFTATLSDEVRWLGWTSLAMMTVLLVILLVVIWRRPAITSTLLGWVPGLGRDRVERLVARVRDFETSTYGFVGGHPARLAVVIACEFLFHGLSFCETYLTVWLLSAGQITSPLVAFVLDTVNRVINVAFVMVPLKVGVAETGTGLVADAIGVGLATGVTMALVGKLRVLAWAVIGLAIGSGLRE